MFLIASLEHKVPRPYRFDIKIISDDIHVEGPKPYSVVIVLKDNKEKIEIGSVLR